jgi:fatty acid desaturase
MHFYSHRAVFKNAWLNSCVLTVLSPFFGVPCGLYYLHHVVMHHVEDNHAGRDLSSTEPYQRDSLLHFGLYWLRFVALVWFELPAYALRTRRYGLAFFSAWCTCAGAALVGTLLQADAYWHGAVWLFVMPTLLNSLLLMLGNWSQHIFIDPDAPRSDYHLTYNVINSACNQRTFNDGYHTEHHLNSRKHWSELPSSFMSNLQRYAEEDAIVFKDTDFISIGCLVFRQRYDLLARHYVQLRHPPRSVQEIEAKLRACLRPVC